MGFSDGSSLDLGDILKVVIVSNLNGLVSYSLVVLSVGVVVHVPKCNELTVSFRKHALHVVFKVIGLNGLVVCISNLTDDCKGGETGQDTNSIA